MFVSSLSKAFHNFSSRNDYQRIVRQILFLAVLLFLCSLPHTAVAVTLGKTTLKSTIGKPLLLEIELRSITAAQARKLRFYLLPKHLYSEYKLNYSSVLSDLSVVVKKHSGGSYYLKVSSRKRIKEDKLSIAIIHNGRVTKIYIINMKTRKIFAPKPHLTKKKKPHSLIKTKPRPLASEVSPQALEKIQTNERNTGSIQTSKTKAIQKSAPQPKAQVNSAQPQASNKTTKTMANGTTSAQVAAEKDFEQLLLDNPPAVGSTEVVSIGKSSRPATLDRYKVKLSVDEQISKPGPPAVLAVWIGDPALTPDTRPGTVSVDTSIAAVGETAKVKPFAPNFTIEPAEHACIKIDPTGSEARFTLTDPKASGTHEVGATVDLYETPDCSGLAVPKPVTSLKVSVVVNARGVAENLGLQLWDKFWSTFLDFWGWAVATFFALLMFLIRKKLKKIFGFVDPTDGAG